ncbi:hypothetical protein GGP41_004193 [Bipolaris sorokiniana]|uniref:Uncharacterized protein n=1 Tax=Cochliobolus sativus TaxID=45130 RepID=A0A8H5ZIX8_COCSA|nr:hypothetical protein GGP41_004193 [Bipolaris sorokiniana]
MAPTLGSTKDEKKNAAKDPAPQIKELSFTNNGRAFKHPQGFDDGPIFINARGANSKMYKRPEKEEDIIVFDPADTEHLPLMAVVETSDEELNSVATYVLLHQHNDLCTPYSAGADDVYYMAMFRDNSTSKHNRKASWNQNVVKYATTPSTSTSTTKLITHRRGRDQSALVLPPNMSLRNEMDSLVANYRLSQDTWFLEELERILGEIDNDVSMAPPTNTALHKFANLGYAESEQYTPEDAQKLVDEVCIAWPDLVVETLHVYLLGQAVKLLPLPIPYKDLQAYIREGLYRIKKAISKGQIQPKVLETAPDDSAQVAHLTKIAEKTHLTVERVLGFANFKVPEPISSDGAIQLLKATKKKLVDLVEGDDAFVKMVAKSTGDQALAVNYQDVWAHFCEQSDTDAARAAFTDIVKITVVALHHKESHLARKLRQMIKELNKVGC